MIFKAQNSIFLFLAYAVVGCLICLNLENSFFWDGVLYGSKQAHFYYSNNFSALLFPDHIDSGYLPTLGLYIAAVWKIFGRSVAITHLAMLPFVIGIVTQLYRLCRKSVGAEYSGLTLLLILSSTTLLSQLTIVSPDVPVLFFFLLATNAAMENKKYQLCVSIFFLFAISMRGTMLAFCILMLDLYCNFNFREQWQIRLKKLLKRSFIYLPGLFLLLAYNYYHFLQKGWILTHANSPWANTMQQIDAKGLLFNIAVLGWHLLNLGKIIIWALLFILLIKLKKNAFGSRESRRLLFFLICILLFVHLCMMWASNMLAPRYFMPLDIILGLLCATILFSSAIKEKLKYALAAIWFTVMVSGSFWIYPPKIDFGWDSTLAHIPYFKLRHEAIAYLDQEQIELESVQSFFPNLATLDEIDLNNDQRKFQIFDGNGKYVFYSNVYNVRDEEYDKIVDPKSYQPIKTFKKMNVWITIYQKNESAY